jgi:hypothetical protein
VVPDARGTKMQEVTDTTPSTNNLPVIKTDLVVPYKALEIYRDRIIKSINSSITSAQEDLKLCIKHKDNRGWDLERREVETKLYWLRDVKKRLYISRFELQQLHGIEFHFTRDMKESQKRAFAWRNQVILRDGFKCRKCGCSVGLEGHHIYSYQHEPDLRYDINNGITFCDQCHKAFHKSYGLFTNMVDLISFLGVGH